MDRNVYRPPCFFRLKIVRGIGILFFNLCGNSNVRERSAASSDARLSCPFVAFCNCTKAAFNLAPNKCTVERCGYCCRQSRLLSPIGRLFYKVERGTFARITFLFMVEVVFVLIMMSNVD